MKSGKVVLTRGARGLKRRLYRAKEPRGLKSPQHVERYLVRVLCPDALIRLHPAQLRHIVQGVDTHRDKPSGAVSFLTLI